VPRATLETTEESAQRAQLAASVREVQPSLLALPIATPAPAARSPKIALVMQGTQDWIRHRASSAKQTSIALAMVRRLLVLRAW
jgi:hypothetical protein